MNVLPNLAAFGLFLFVTSQGGGGGNGKGWFGERAARFAGLPAAFLAL